MLFKSASYTACTKKAPPKFSFRRCLHLIYYVTKKSKLVQSFFFQPNRQQVGKLYIILFRKQEMRVAFNALFRQMYHRGITTVTIDALGKQLCHLKTNAPTVHCPVVARLIGNIITIIDNDGEMGQFLKVGQWYGRCTQCSEWTDSLQGIGNLTFWKNEATTRFIRDNGMYVIALDSGMPTRSAALRMGDEDATADSVHQSCHISSNQLFVICPRIRRNLAKKLIQRFCRLRKLAAVIIIGPYTHTKVLKPKLVICRCLDSFIHHTAPSTSTTRLVYQIYAELTAQEKSRETFASVRGAFPRLSGLSRSVQKYKRILTGIYRNLIRHVSMVTVQCLTICFQRLVCIIGPRLRLYRTTYQKTALLADSKDTIIHYFLLRLRQLSSTACTQGKQDR